MRKARCTLPEGGTIIVESGQVRRVIAGGDVVDLDQVLVPPAFTMADALGHHVDEHFELTAPAVQTSAQVRPTAAAAADEE